MKKLTFACVAAVLALMPRTASAQEVCQIVGSGTEQICYTGIFPSNPIIIELGQSIRLPATTYRNLTTRTIEFTIEWAGIDIPGSAVIDRRQLGPGATANLGELAFAVDGLDIGTRRIAIGWTATGQEYGLTRELQFDVTAVMPGQIREIIQVPIRYCAIEGSPQAQGRQPGELVSAATLLSVLRRASDEIWLPQAGILFRHADAPQGIPVVKDPEVGQTLPLGDVGIASVIGLGEWSSAAHFCDVAWNERYPGQRGIVVVNVRDVVGTGDLLGGVAPAVPLELRVATPGEPKTGQRGNALCGNPRALNVGDVTYLLRAATYDPALYKRFPYTSDTFEPAKVLGHELGHALTLGHGNGWDDNGDGLLPPTIGIRRFDEYCDPLGAAEHNPALECSLMQSGACKNITPLQREMARAAAKLVPGAVLPDPVADPAGHLVAAPGACPPDCSTPTTVKIQKIEMADTPGPEVTSFTHTVIEHPDGGPYRYSVYADLDNNSQTGCPIAVSGQPEFVGAELHTVVTLNAGSAAAPTMWRCDGGVWTEVQDPAVTASAYALSPVVHDQTPTAKEGVVSIQMPNALRGPAGTHVRLQAIAEGESHTDLLPTTGTGGVVSLIPPDLATCSVSPVVARPGQSVSITATRLPGSRAADVFIAGLKSGSGSTAANGSLTVDVAVPATLQEGLRSVEVGVQNGAAVASCAVLIQGQAVTPATTATLNPVPNFSGWNNANVSVSLNAVDVSGGPGIQSVSYAATGAQTIAPTTQPGAAVNVAISAEGQTVLQFYATNNGGVSEAPHSVTISLDKTLPTITYSGNHGVYGVLDTVDISCTAADSLSGLLSTTCADISGPAYQFALTGNTYSATATDFAGNVAQASTSFQIRVTYADLCTLTRQFIASSGAPPDQAALLGQSLCAQLSAAQQAAAKGNAAAKRAAIAAYVRQVTAIAPSILTAQQATILVNLANAL
jgi:hypothetical protein